MKCLLFVFLILVVGCNSEADYDVDASDAQMKQKLAQACEGLSEGDTCSYEGELRNCNMLDERIYCT